MKLLSALFALVLSATSAMAATVTAPNSANNGFAGIMFDITTGNEDITLTELSTDFGADAGTIDLWLTVGGIAGKWNSSAQWTLVSTLDFAGSNQEFDAWDVGDIALSANTTYGLYISDRNYTTGVRYRNYASRGQFIAGDANLSIYAGNGKAPDFGRNFRPRGFVGSISYEIPTIPVPASLPLLLAALGGMAALGRRR